MTKSLREEIEASLHRYLGGRLHCSIYEQREAKKAYLSGAIDFAIRALEIAAALSDKQHPCSYELRKLADELRGKL